MQGWRLHCAALRSARVPHSRHPPPFLPLPAALSNINHAVCNGADCTFRCINKQEGPFRAGTAVSPPW